MDDVAIRLQQEEDLKAKYRVVTSPALSGTATQDEHPSCRAITVFPVAIGGKRECRCLVRRDNLVFVGVWGGGLAIVDVADPAQPRIVGTLGGAVELTSFVLAGNVLYASDWTAGVHVIDVGTPTRPTLLATHPALTHTQNRRVLVSGHTLVLVNEHAFSVFDIAEPARPQPLAYHYRMRTGVGWLRGAAIAASTLLVTQGAMGVWAFDLSDPRTPRPLCGIGLRLENRPNDRIVAEALVLFEGRAFVGTSSGVWCMRLSPAGPQSEVFFTGPGTVHETAHGESRDGRLYLCAFEPHDHVHHIFDVAQGPRYHGRQRLSRMIERVWDFAFGARDTVAAAGNDGLLIATP